MLFNSPEFLFAFLPLTLALFFLFGSRLGPRAAMFWLIAASLFFYSWWEPKNLLLLVFSLLFNYQLSQWLIARTEAKRPSKPGLVLGIAVNLGLLGWFKYANFFADNIGSLVGRDWDFGTIVLPLAISFFTFQQISYLVDGYRGQVQRCSALDYTLVVTFFPHLIAGPIVRYQSVLPQFKVPGVFAWDANRVGCGLTLFVMGLFKKMVFADGIAPYANSAFDAAAQGVTLTFSEAWVGALAYTCQLYFDFSGYSDMAIGIAWMFGIRFALNFDSPYKATSIIDFWRRWHMTLSAFLRDYLYIALGGSRHGAVRRYANLATTMLLGGLWHGAGWTFVVWGGLHGSYLVVNHGWRALSARLGFTDERPLLPRPVAWLITFLAVVAAWVLFRAHDLSSAGAILASMVGVHGFEWAFTANVGIPRRYAVIGIVVLLAIAVTMPNTQQWLARFSPAVDRPDRTLLRPVQHLVDRVHWRPGVMWSVLGGAMAAACVLSLTRVSQFIYFQF